MSGQRVNIDDPRVPELIRLYKSGMSRDAAARAVKMRSTRAAELIREAGVERPLARWTPDRIAAIRTMRRSGKSWAQIGAEFRCLPETVREAYVRNVAREDRAADRMGKAPPHTVVGHVSEHLPTLAQRVAAEVDRLGAAVLLHHRGRYITAAVDSEVAQAAEHDGAIIGTYTEGVHPAWIAEDLREACR